MVKQEANLAYLLKGPKDANIEEVPMPPSPGPNEVLLRTLAVGICGSDIHYWNTGRCGTFVVTEPMILGHETSAQVVEVGANVKNLKVGDRVVTEPAVPCEHCSYCRGGKYNLCEDIVCHATPPKGHGTLTNFFLHPAGYTFPIPDVITDEEAAMIEPLSVAVHANKRCGVTVGSKVLITGAGPIGIYALMTAKAYGATRVVLTDINAGRLAVAKELGADEVIQVTSDLTEAQLVAKVRDAFHGQSPDISMECSGAGACSRLVLLATRSGGVAIQIGMGPPDVSLPIADAAIREVTILGSFRYKDCFPTAIELAASGKLNLKKLVSFRYDFKDCTQAYETAKSGAGMKVVIKVSESA